MHYMYILTYIHTCMQAHNIGTEDANSTCDTGIVEFTT